MSINYIYKLENVVFIDFYMFINLYIQYYKLTAVFFAIIDTQKFKFFTVLFKGKEYKNTLSLWYVMDLLNFL